MGWNRGHSARGCDVTESLGVNQLAGGVALPKLLYRAAPSSGFFSAGSEFLLLFHSIHELNASLLAPLHARWPGLSSCALCSELTAVCFLPRAYCVDTTAAGNQLRTRIGFGFWIWTAREISTPPAGKANSRHTPDRPLFNVLARGGSRFSSSRDVVLSISSTHGSCSVSS